MKKGIILFAFICISLFASSQTRFGIRGGLNIANQKFKFSYLGESFSVSGDGLPSFHIGGMAETPLSEIFFIQSALLLSGKGTVIEEDDGMGNTEKATIRPYYLEIPVVIVAKKNLPENFTVFGGAGPSLGYGIFGKAKDQASGESGDVFTTGGYKRFDFGIDLTAGVELRSGWQFSFHYTAGLANIGDDDDPDIDLAVKNKVAGFSIGYFFSGKK